MEFLQSLKKSDAFGQRLAGLCYSRGIFQNWQGDPDFESAFKDQYLRNSIYLQIQKQISESALNENICLTWLKGIELIRSVYQNPGERFLSDIDVLVSPAELPQLRKMFVGLGARQIQSASESRLSDFKEIWNFPHSHSAVPVEIHTQLFYHEPKNWIWQRNPQGQLSSEDFLLHLCGHCAFQHTFLQSLWLIDIFLYLQVFHDKISFQVLLNRARQLSLLKSVEVCLLLIEREFRWKMRESLEFPQIKFSSSARTLARRLDRSFLLDPQRQAFKYLYTKHAIKDCFLQSLKYDALWIQQKLSLQQYRRKHPTKSNDNG